MLSDAPPRLIRRADEMRPISLEREVLPFAEGSCLVSFGATRVLCSASLQENVPDWRREHGSGWLTAEYAMLPRATAERTARERNHIGGRTHEIQRLIGRALRAATDLDLLGQRTIIVDCDVLVADGGTRTAAITGAAVAVHDACTNLLERSVLERNPLRELVAGISVGIIDNEHRLDLDYPEDAAADVDLNLVALESGLVVEVQGTAEGSGLSRDELGELVDLAFSGIQQLIALQREILDSPK